MTDLQKNSYIYKYYEAMNRGYIEIDGKQVRFIVGNKIKKAVRKIMGYFDDPRFYFDPTYCYKRFKFQETLCLQGYAPFYNEPVKLMLWQQMIDEAKYSFYEVATGKRLVNVVFEEVGRKNGKSTKKAADVNTDLFIGKLYL